MIFLNRFSLCGYNSKQSQICEEPEAQPAGHVIDRTGKKPRAQFLLCRLWYQIIMRLQRIRAGAESLSISIGLIVLSSPARVLLHHCCLCHVSLSSCERQRKGDGEARTSSYAKQFSTSFHIMCLCASEFPLMLNNEVRPPCF